MDPYHICIALCLFGSFFLMLLGTLCLNGYPYLHLQCTTKTPGQNDTVSAPHPGWTCVYAALLYLLIIILIILRRAYSKSISPYSWDSENDSSDEDEPLIKYEKKKFR